MGYRFTTLPVFQDGSLLTQSMIGGLNTPQFSSIDLDGDGTQDLAVFDRSGNVIKTFLWDESSGDYDYAPVFEKEFPGDVIEFMFLKDYNCDGKADLFTYKQGGFKIYRNLGTYPLSWQLETETLFSDFGSFETNVLILTGDIPGIEDIDGDGDLDILVFGSSSFENSIEYHRNRSMEDFGTCDSLKYELVTRCWGNIEEPENSSELVQIFCKGPGGNPEAFGGSSRDEVHPGSTILLIDTDNDGDQDLVLGDIQTDRFVFGPNTGDATTANIEVAQQIPDFPTSDPTRMEYLTAGYTLDVDHDGIEDLITSVNNTIDSSANNGNVWYYRNTSAGAVNYQLQTKEFLLEDMLDLGDGTCPGFFDVDGDGLQDLIVASSYEKTPTSSRGARLAYFRNIGSAFNPIYELVDNDFADLSQLSLNGICPAFGNLDGDNDLDMIIGDADGHLHYFENNPSGGVANFTLTQPIYQGITSIGFNAAPEIVDVNGDGLLDLLVGERTGEIAYFENEGNQGSASFPSDPTIEEFGKIDISFFCCGGRAVPRVVNNPSFGSGRYLMVGSDEKRVLVYEMPSNLNDSLAILDSILVNEGRIAPSFADITNDGNPEMIVGTRTGGLKLFQREGDYPVGTAPIVPVKSEVSVFPNPATDQVSIEANIDFHQVELFSITGKRIASFEQPSGNRMSIDVSGIPTGMYLLRVMGHEEATTLRLLLTE